jgi:hypothetical protein
MIEQIITQKDVSKHLRGNLQRAWIFLTTELVEILKNSKQAGNRKTVITSDFNNVHFTAKDIDEILELLEQKNIITDEEE